MITALEARELVQRASTARILENRAEVLDRIRERASRGFDETIVMVPWIDSDQRVRDLVTDLIGLGFQVESASFTNWSSLVIYWGKHERV